MWKLSIAMSRNTCGEILTSDENFAGADFSNAVLDRVNFEKADLQGAIFRNAVLSGSTFGEAKLEDAVFEDTIIGYIDLQKLCTNTSISEEGRALLGCRWPLLLLKALYLDFAAEFFQISQLKQGNVFVSLIFYLLILMSITY